MGKIREILNSATGVLTSARSAVNSFLASAGRIKKRDVINGVIRVLTSARSAVSSFLASAGRIKKRDVLNGVIGVFKPTGSAINFFAAAAGGLKEIAVNFPLVATILSSISQLMFSHQYYKKFHSDGISRLDIGVQCGVAVLSVGVAVAGITLLAMGTAATAPALVLLGICGTALSACAAGWAVRVRGNDPEYKMASIQNLLNVIDPDLASEICDVLSEKPQLKSITLDNGKQKIVPMGVTLSNNALDKFHRIMHDPKNSEKIKRCLSDIGYDSSTDVYQAMVEAIVDTRNTLASVFSERPERFAKSMQVGNYQKMQRSMRLARIDAAMKVGVFVVVMVATGSAVAVGGYIPIIGAVCGAGFIAKYGDDIRNGFNKFTAKVVDISLWVGSNIRSGFNKFTAKVVDISLWVGSNIRSGFNNFVAKISQAFSKGTTGTHQDFVDNPLTHIDDKKLDHSQDLSNDLQQKSEPKFISRHKEAVREGLVLSELGSNEFGVNQVEQKISDSIDGKKVSHAGAKAENRSPLDFDTEKRRVSSKSVKASSKQKVIGLVRSDITTRVNDGLAKVEKQDEKPSNHDEKAYDHQSTPRAP